MKKYKSLLDVLIVTLLAVLSAVTIFPSIAMPSNVQMVLLVALFGLTSGFVVLVWRERPKDEREAEHQQLASRSAYLAGCATLIVVLAVQGFRHQVDSAIPLTLLLMIGSKLAVQRLKDRS